MSTAPLPFFTEDAELDDGPEIDWGHSSLTEVLEDCLSRLAYFHSRMDRIAADRDAMVAKYQAWADRKAAPFLARVNFYEGTVRSLIAQEVDEHPKGPKTFRLPSGVVRHISPRQRVVVDDPEAFREWVVGREDAEELSKWDVRPVRDGIRRVLADGEVVPGVRLDEGERSVTISLGAEE